MSGTDETTAGTPLRASARQDAKTLSTAKAVSTAKAAATTATQKDDYTATSLSPSGKWSAGSSSGAFTWSYPIASPPALGGHAPSVSLDYDSSSVDGRTPATNAQTSWIGEGWDYSPGFIERTYKGCSKDGVTGSGDLCWDGLNATISFGGHSTALVRDDTSGAWRLADDDGSTLQLLTGATNGDGGGSGGDGTGTDATDPAHTGRVAGAGASGEYWKLTTLDGTAYYFGLNHLPGGPTTDVGTGSVWTAPVFGNNKGEPCYVGTTFTGNWCQQAWRWNLDFVVDPHGNLTTYSYQQGSGATQVSPEVNAYARGTGTGTVTSYTRGGTLQSISYGYQLSDAIAAAKGTGTVKPTAKILFTSAERCLAGGSVACTTANRTLANQTSWPDTPLDQACATTATSCTTHSPTFWSSLRLTQIDTQVLSGTGTSATYTTVDTYNLTHTFPSAQDDPLKPALWLSQIVRTGKDGGSLALTSPVTFTGVLLPNRIDGTATGQPRINRYRLSKITTETGEVDNIRYSDPACSSTALPTADNNTTSCFPAYWTVPNGTAPTLDWFNKYQVIEVDAADGTTANSPTHVSTYTYTNPAWHRDDAETTDSSNRTWGEFRGYRNVAVRTGQASSTTVTENDTTYLQGMNGDATAAGGSKSVTVTGVKAPAITDDNWLAGMVRESDTYTQTTQQGGTLVSATYTDPYASAIEATHTKYGVTGGPAMTSRIVDKATTTTTQLVTKGPDTTGTTWRTSSTSWTYDSRGLVTSVDDRGDGNTATTTDPERCTTTSYASNATNLMYSYPSTVTTFAGPCTANMTSSNTITSTQTLYDNATTPGAGLTTGNPTAVQTLDTWDANGPHYLQVSAAGYDGYGRVTSSTDATGHTTTTGYSPTTAGLPTSVTSTNPLGWTTVTTYDPARAQALTVTDVNGEATTMKYDPLGRLTGVWKPGRNPSSQSANLTYAYSVPGGTTPAAVTTGTLSEDQAYNLDVKIYDGLLQLRQEQTTNKDDSSGRIIADTFYDSHGWVIKTNNPYPDTTASGPSTTLWVAADNTVNGQNATFYDGMGRPTATTYSSKAVEQWRTTTSYPGLDRVDTTPPAGGTSTTTYTDVRGHTTAAWDYTAGTAALPGTPGSPFTPDGVSAHADKTTYSYDAGDHQTGITDAEGNTWTYHYNYRGQRDSSTDPDAGPSTTTYYNDGQIKTSTTQTTATQTNTLYFQYDALGRKVKEYNTDTNGTQIAQWDYDGVTGAKGQLSSSTRWDGGNPYTTSIDGYTPTYQPTSTTVHIPASEGALATLGSSAYTVQQSYTPVTSELDTTFYPAVGGLPVENVYHSYNGHGLPNSIGSDTTYYQSNFAYTAFGEPAVLSMGPWPHETTITNTYDNGTRRRLTTELKQMDSPNAAIDLLTYTYNAHGDPTATTDLRSTGTVASQTTDTQCYQYDSRDRLTQAWTDTAGVTTQPGPAIPGLGACTTTSPSVATDGTGTVGGPAPYWLEWSYDAIGNRLFQKNHSTTSPGAGVKTVYTQAAPGAAQPHAIATAKNRDLVNTTLLSSSTYSYTASGQTKTRPGTGGGSQSLTYTVDGHLASLTQTGGTTPGTTSYVYDADGNQLIKRSPGSTTLYLLGQEITLTTSGAQAGTLSGVRYYPGPDSVIARSSTGAISYQFTDPHGTGTTSIDATTLAITRRNTTPYGTPRGTTPTTWIGQKTFVGGTGDTTTGLTLLGARNYDPILGAFTTTDPVIDNDARQLNAYTYAYDNPISGSDPTGLRTDDGYHCTSPGHCSGEGLNNAGKDTSPPPTHGAGSSGSSGSGAAAGAGAGAAAGKATANGVPLSDYQVWHAAAVSLWSTAIAWNMINYQGGTMLNFGSYSSCDIYIQICNEFPIPGGSRIKEGEDGRADVAFMNQGEMYFGKHQLVVYEIKYIGSQQQGRETAAAYAKSWDDANSGDPDHEASNLGADILHGKQVTMPDPLGSGKTLVVQYDPNRPKDGPDTGYVAYWLRDNTESSRGTPIVSSQSLIQRWASGTLLPKWLTGSPIGPGLSSPDPAPVLVP